MFDYSNCDKDEEPEVVHIDQESDYKKTFLAKDFETFIRGLVNEEEFEETGENPTSPQIVSAKFSDEFLEKLKKFKEKND
jgi:hypothetical protein